MAPKKKLIKSKKSEPEMEQVDLNKIQRAAVSRLKDENFSFLWTLKDYKELSQRTEIQSPVFIGGPKFNHEWYLTAKPRRTEDNVNYFQIFLGLLKCDKPQIYNGIQATFRIRIVDTIGNVLHSSLTGYDCYYPQGTLREFCKLLPSVDLLNPSKGYLVNEGKDLMMHCEVSIAQKASHIVLDNPSLKSTQILELESMSIFQKQMKSLIGDKTFSDVVLKTRTKSSPALKGILAARSPVFRAMFQSENLESSSNTVLISDFPAKTVGGMLEYMYMGKTDSLQENAMDLLRIADKYQLLSLKESCEEVISRNITVENVVEILTFAHLHSPTVLKPFAISFINGSKALVEKMESFKKLSTTNPTLLLELYSSL